MGFDFENVIFKIFTIKASKIVGLVFLLMCLIVKK